MDREFRSLDRWSIAVGLCAAVFFMAMLAELALGGQAVKQHYAERAIEEAVAREHFSEPPPDYPLATFYASLTQPAFEVSAPIGERQAQSGVTRHPAVVAAIAGAAAAFGLAIATLGWVWRAQSNLAKAGQRANYTPAKALVAFCIPFGNLALAPDAMRELYNRSHGEPEELIESPADDVTAWFAAMMGGTVILSLLVAKYMLDLASNLAIVTPLWMEFSMAGFAVLLLAASGLLFFRLTRIIGRGQSETLTLAETIEAPASRPGVRLIGAEANRSSARG